MPRRVKGWKVRVLKYGGGPLWRLGTVVRAHKEYWWQKEVRASQLTERDARKAFADHKKEGREVQLVNPEGVVVKWVNKP